MTRRDLAFALVATLVLAALVLGLRACGRESDRRRQACTDRGGIVVPGYGPRGFVCKAPEGARP